MLEVLNVPRMGAGLNFFLTKEHLRYFPSRTGQKGLPRPSSPSNQSHLKLSPKEMACMRFPKISGLSLLASVAILAGCAGGGNMATPSTSGNGLESSHMQSQAL